MARSFAALVLVALCGLARPAGPALDVRAVAVYPYAFGWEEPAYRSLLKSADAVAALAALRRVQVIPPGEFKVAQFADDNVLAGSDAARAMAARRLPPRAFVVLRAWADRLGARTLRESVVDGVGRSELADDTTVVAHVQVLDATSGEVVADLSGQVRPGAGGAAGGSDPDPELTRLHRKLVAQACEALAARLPAIPAAGGAGAIEAAAFEGFDLPGRASLAEIARRDPIAGAAARQEIARYLAELRAR